MVQRKITGWRHTFLFGMSPEWLLTPAAPGRRKALIRDA
jgi:hypothetical protein